MLHLMFSWLTVLSLMSVIIRLKQIRFLKVIFFLLFIQKYPLYILQTYLLYIVIGYAVILVCITLASEIKQMWQSFLFNDYIFIQVF